MGGVGALHCSTLTVPRLHFRLWIRILNWLLVPSTSGANLSTLTHD